MNGAFILARYSTENQNEASIEVQVGRCSEWCVKNGVPILGVFADRAISGMKSTRPEYERMMKSLRNGGADVVVIYDQSRMFRDMLLWFQFRAEVDALGVRVVSVTQPTIGGNLKDPAIFLNEGITALFNQMWVLQSQQKICEGVRQRARSGKHTGGTPPLGYKVEHEVLVVDEKEAPTVRLIFEMYAAGQSYMDIIYELNRRGLTTKRGKPFGKNSLHDLLKNRKYIGQALFGGKAVGADGKRNSHATRVDYIETECPAIVDKNTFEIVQERLKNNQKSSGRRVAVVDQPLKGKVFCGECGSAMTISFSYAGKDKKRYEYYKCAAKKMGHDCDATPIRKAELEDTVADMIINQLGNPVSRKNLFTVLEAQRAERLRNRAPELLALQTKINKLEKQLDRATDSILNGLSSPALISKINEMEQAKMEAIAARARLSDETKHLNIDMSKLDTLLDGLLADRAHAVAAALAMVLRVEVCRDCIKVWTIFDDPEKIDGTDKVTAKTVAKIVPADEHIYEDVEYNCGCPIWRTNIYAQAVIVLLLLRRPQKR